MGVLRRDRLFPAMAFAIAAVGVVACEPGGLSALSVAHTTDVAATAEIQRRHVDVRWLTCTAQYKDEKKAGAVAAVDCRGKTTDGRDITVDGRIARAVDGACVRGDLTAVVGGKQLFRVSGLGDCKSATPSPVKPSGSAAPGVRPTVTVTVTETVGAGGAGK
ncbi:hypothetical protein QF032_002747 [Streptomyces achromogenes]|uniref:hypothetical protein n=1 Tax=Streptomyces achromogenes TaxID=67255 RepID=UPI002789D9F5|nr:hypothetical protein [Streptomyces achromogenes]MDQ0830903.1 hypothetical protein [Streptomyces achromogenes]